MDNGGIDMRQLRIKSGHGPFVGPKGVVAMVLALVLLVSPAGAGSNHDKGFVLEIVEKRYDEATGDLTVRVRNRSIDLWVTAFGFSRVGGGSRDISSWEKYITGGIAPGAYHESVVSLGETGDPSTAFTARSVKLHHEIRSDNTSFGDTEAIEMWFERRVASYVEHERALVRLREETGNQSASFRALAGDDIDTGREAQRRLLDTSISERGRSQRETARLSAIASVSDMLFQADRWIESGERTEQEALAYLKDYFERKLAILAENLRPIDLERYGR